MRSYNKAGEPLKDTTATPALGLTRDIGTSQKLKENSYIKVYATPPLYELRVSPLWMSCK